MLGLLDIDPAAAAPIWRQIEDGMRRLVASGALPAGTAVPSVRDLARELRVNPATVSKAYQQLTADGALEVRRGEGTFVTKRSAGALADERGRLLGDGARAYIEAARSMGVSKKDAMAAISTAWREITDAVDGGTT
ncbi:MAG: GntR family transcriptional regulator [Thermoanaerobaculales bacterium]|jgi:GntR family transcriptional regulator|nr:GntR family transcriptional regulator [Thermoanaerobaculales bacterium]